MKERDEPKGTSRVYGYGPIPKRKDGLGSRWSVGGLRGQGVLRPEGLSPFVGEHMGGDQFIPSPSLRGTGPALTFAQKSAPQRTLARAFLQALPRDTARKVGIENAVRLYKLTLR